MKKINNFARIIFLIVFCLILSSCGFGNEFSDSLSEENEPTIAHDEEPEYKFDDSDDEAKEQSEFFEIHLAGLSPMLLDQQIESENWQRSSFLPGQLNSLEGVSLVDFAFEYRRNFRQSWYYVTFRLINETDKTLIFYNKENDVLEKYIDGEWYVVPLYGGASEYLRRVWFSKRSLEAHSESRTVLIELNLWRPNSDGLYRFVTEVTCESHPDERFLLSDTFELNRADFRTRFEQERINSVGGVSLEVVEFNYETTMMKLSLINNSRNNFTFGPFWVLEEFIDGEWYEVPINTIAPLGSRHRRQGAAFPVAMFSSLQSTSELFASVQNWHPLSTGTFRLIKEIFNEALDRGVPHWEREYFPISVIFNITE